MLASISTGNAGRNSNLTLFAGRLPKRLPRRKRRSLARSLLTTEVGVL